MSLVGDTGNGATLTLTTQTAANSYKITKIVVGETTLNMLDVSNLGTSEVMERIASDLVSVGDATIDYIFNPQATAISITRAVDTAVITLPVYSTQTTTVGATYSGTGVVTSIKPVPDLQNGMVMMGQMKFSYDGNTGPTYVRGS